MLSPKTVDLGAPLIAGLQALVGLSVFDRYPVPQALGPGVWDEERRELVRRLQI